MSEQSMSYEPCATTAASAFRAHHICRTCAKRAQIHSWYRMYESVEPHCPESRGCR
ncbi:hypothetical protein M378DRAFT_160068 [Amanita muscaria Koide BX008]|uniref:Uncharacterized protein n=1 Tax=Amanita muscaria (strain Koide BX008) TaxID=946122 RepID=A0A0C2XCH8_AMAMK|nr:hypothetical protein M378DRAFT_160068 [Amanita muscaria Koide BX008]